MAGHVATRSIDGVWRSTRSANTDSSPPLSAAMTAVSSTAPVMSITVTAHGNPDRSRNDVCVRGRALRVFVLANNPAVVLVGDEVSLGVVVVVDAGLAGVEVRGWDPFGAAVAAFSGRQPPGLTRRLSPPQARVSSVILVLSAVGPVSAAVVNLAVIGRRGAARECAAPVSGITVWVCALMKQPGKSFSRTGGRCDRHPSHCDRPVVKGEPYDGAAGGVDTGLRR